MGLPDKSTEKPAEKAVAKFVPHRKRKLTPEQRKLTPEQIEKALKKAKAKGLPDGWTVELNNDNKKIWISPDASRKCLTIPLALAWSVKKGMIPDDKMPTKYNEERLLTQEEIDADLKKAKEKGLPDGWTVEWNAKRHQRNWISPDGNRRCHDLRQALAYSIKTGLTSADKIPANPEGKKTAPHERSLTEEEVEEAMKKAKEQGLPAGWKVEWNRKENRRIWISPDGIRKCNGISQALTVSVKMGLIPADKMPQRVLTPKEVKELLEKAKERGLPEGWKVEWDNKKNQRVWLSPDGNRRFNSLPQAIALSKKKVPGTSPTTVPGPAEPAAPAEPVQATNAAEAAAPVELKAESSVEAEVAAPVEAKAEPIVEATPAPAPSSPSSPEAKTISV